MKRYLLVFAILASLGMGLFLTACGDHDEYRHKDYLTQQSDNDDNAKDRSDDQLNCELFDLVIEDCFDACSCCYFGQEENINLCVTQCDALLMKQYEVDHEPTKADYTRYKECTLGCVSVCEANEKDDTCFEECKIYLGL